ncbi:MAG: hypothetical protein H7X94_07475, partial [Vallitaleaceae bacterium]|nr:hypothetical protein [Vallitaleaceae bacterium]
MENKEKAHVISMPYASIEEALSREESSFIQSLNGVWNFQLTQGTEALQESELSQKDILRPFDEIVVPGVWQLQGYEQQDPPYFIQQGYPPTVGKKHVPNIDLEANVSGSYFRTVMIPVEWQHREIFICFAGVKSAFYLWVNGQKVGYSQGSMTPAEFNITKYLSPGEESSVYVEVLRYCDSTYLEGHNTWFLSGIYRDVFLYAEPKIYIGDYFLHCQFDPCYEDAVLKVQVEVVNKTGENEPIGVELFLSQNLSEIYSGYSTSCRMVAKGNQKSNIVMELMAKSPKKWTADGPNLYQGLIVLKDGRGHVVTVKKLTFGFRTVGIFNGQLLVNGLPVLLKGINRHDFDPDTGCTVSRERYEEDLKLLKRCNVNAIRTSYYPNDACFYELCDQYGLYVMNESGVQIHPLGSGDVLSSEEEWKDAMVDRMTRMVARDKNHPCVLIWSLGNEKEQGINFLEMKKEAARLDPTRPFHYEGDFEFKTSDFFSVPTSNLAWMDAIGNKQIIGKKLLRPMQKDGESKVKTI